MKSTIQILAALTGSLGLVQGLALSDFSPMTTGLTGPCEEAYSTTIQGCTVADFSPGSGCSSACLNGLVQINGLISDACQNLPVPNTSLVGIFLQGKGIRALCNIEVVTKTTGSAQQTPTGTPLGPVPKSTSITSSSPPANSNTAPITVGVGSTSSVMSTMTVTKNTASTLSPASILSGQGVSSSVTAAVAQSAQALPKCSQGGGSPFDGAPGQSCKNVGSILGAPLALCIAALIASLMSPTLLV